MLKDGTHGTHKDADNGPYLLSAKNIKDGHIIIDETTDRKISISEFEQIHSKFKLQKGDVLLTIVGSIGESAILENPSNLTFQRSVAFLRPNSTVTSSFLRTTIESSGFQKELQDRKSQSAQPGVYLGELEKIPVSVPSLKEQEQIGSFFTELDDIITLHQRKLESMKLLKKSLLQKMFPKSGETVPEVRFPGFADAWEQRKLGDICKITMGQSPDGKTYSEKPSDYILVQGNADLKNGWVVPRIWTTHMTKKGDAGDLIMSVRAPAGAMGKTAYDVVLGRGVAAIKGNEFIFQTLVKMDSDRYWKKIAAGSTFESINSDAVKNAELLIPSIQEQTKIGCFFTLLDQTITLHQRELFCRS